MALVALDVSALQKAPLLMEQDVDRELLRFAILSAALAGRSEEPMLQAHLFDLRTSDLGAVLSGVPKGVCCAAAMVPRLVWLVGAVWSVGLVEYCACHPERSPIR